MKKISNRGNLPPHLRSLLKQLGGTYSGMETEIYEMTGIDEIEKAACGQLDENIKFELCPAMDQSTNRAFLVGFDAETPKKIHTLNLYVKMKIYFVEITQEQFNTWMKKILKHRELQQDDMLERRDNSKKSRKLTPIKD